MTILITKNTLHQLNLEGKNVVLPFLGQRFHKSKKWQQTSTYKDVGRVMIKILHSLNIPLKMRHEAKYIYEHIHIYPSIYTSS